MADRKLKPLTGHKVGPTEPVRTCEICGAQGVANPFINFILVIGVPGHESLAPIQCEHEEHWACSIPHWLEIAHACVEEHGHEMLVDAHLNLEGSAHNGYAQEQRKA